MAENTAAGIDIDKLIEQFAATGAAQAATRKDIDKQQADLTASVAKETGAIQSEAELTGQVQGMIDELLIKKAGRNAKAAAEFGTNPDASNYVVGELAKSYIETSKELSASAKDLQAKMAVGPTDNLIEWMVNQFTLPSQAQAHNALAVGQEITANTIKELQNKTQEQVKINASIDASTSEAIIAANSKRLLAAAIVKAENAKQEALKTNITIGNVRLATTQAAYADTLSLVRTQIELQQLRQRQKDATTEDELRKARLKELQEHQASDVLLQQDLNRYSQITGARHITPDMYRRMAPQVKADIDEVMIDPNTERGSLASSPALSVERALARNFPLTPGTRHVRDQLTDMMINTQSENIASWSILKPGEKLLKYNKSIAEQTQKELKNVPDTGSMFSAPPLMALGKIPAVEATQLWREYLAPLGLNPAAPTSARQVFETAARAVKEGKIPLEKAADEVATLYQAAVADNHHQRDYGRFSITIAPQYQQSYNTVIPGPGKLWSEKPTDMTNSTAVKNRILRYLHAIEPIESPLTSPGGL